MALIDVPNHQLATVVTTLEMTDRPLLGPVPPSNLRLVAWPAPAAGAYRRLFARVGTPWLWYSRLTMSDAALADLLGDSRIGVYAAVDPAGFEVGIIELDHREPGQCGLVYLGLVPELVGRGHGRWLMAHALALAWSHDTRRVRVDTCTLDHPSALGFYRAAGFTAVRRTIETFGDPRITGLLPADAAPQIPRLGTAKPPNCDA